MFHVKQLLSPEGEGLRAYEMLVRKYHKTLDLVSDRALARFPAMIQQAEAYAELIETLAPGVRVLDIGSGVGLPGIVIALTLPHQDVLLVERRRRRATFLKLAVAHLGLANAHVSESDVRELPLVATIPGSGPSGRDHRGSPRGFGVVTAQAVGSLADIYCLTEHLHDERVILISRKGPGWREEVGALGAQSRCAPAVRAEVALPDSGTLVAIEARGGLSCPPSG
jgi:16S rRNA (guanine527-N7)-methyltransferase